jgi:hypothetical protein
MRPNPTDAESARTQGMLMLRFHQLLLMFFVVYTQRQPDDSVFIPRRDSDGQTSDKLPRTCNHPALPTE